MENGTHAEKTEHYPQADDIGSPMTKNTGKKPDASAES